MNTSALSDSLPDTQASKDRRNQVIHKAGIKDLRYPLSVDLGNGAQSTIGSWCMYVGIPAEIKGTHMSRFVECLEEYSLTNKPLTFQTLIDLEAHMRYRLDQSKEGYIQVHFPYFIRKRAPVSGIQSLLDYEVTLTVETSAEQATSFYLQTRIPVKSLCPCSKTISEYGAHNQRSHILLYVELTNSLALNELIQLAEQESSCEIFGLLKRSDEKWITERAYENPKFVEDLVRDLALRMSAHPAIRQFTVSAENFESIHNHSAFAEIHGHGLGTRASTLHSLRLDPVFTQT
jgi:GTP cyclohydrolase IB